MRLAIAVAISALVFVEPTSAQSTDLIHACVKGNGSTRIVSSPDDCGNNETYVFWNQEGPQGEPGPEGPQGPQGPAGPPGSGGSPVPAVLDALQEYVGSVLTVVNGDPRLLVMIVLMEGDGGEAFTLETDSRGFFDTNLTNNLRVRFATGDCSGQAYIALQGGFGNARAGVGGGSAYLWNGGEPLPANTNMFSVLDLETVSCNSFRRQGNWVPADPVKDLTVFQAPFELGLQ